MMWAPPIDAVGHAHSLLHLLCQGDTIKETGFLKLENEIEFRNTHHTKSMLFFNETISIKYI